MTPADKLGYLANIERCKAQQAIHMGNYDPCDHRGVYHLWLLAWGNEDMARKAQSLAAERMMERQCSQHSRK